MTILHYIPSIDEASGGVGAASLPDHSVLAAAAELNKLQQGPTRCMAVCLQNELRIFRRMQNI